MIPFLAVALLAPASAADGSRTAIAPAAPGWFVCDGTDAPVAILAGAPGRDGAAAFTTLDKRIGAISTTRYAVGRGDPGAGQIFYALSVGGREAGNVHAVNPGMIPSGQATTPLVTSVTIGGRAVQCRWLADTVASGITARRGITITHEHGRLVYRAFGFAHPGAPVHPDGVQRSTVPTLELRGGVERRGADRRRSWRFANAGYAYVVSAREDASDASLTVFRGGRLVQRERFLGLSLAR